VVEGIIDENSSCGSCHLCFVVVEWASSRCQTTDASSSKASRCRSGPCAAARYSRQSSDLGTDRSFQSCAKQAFGVVVEESGIACSAQIGLVFNCGHFAVQWHVPISFEPFRRRDSEALRERLSAGAFATTAAVRYPTWSR